MNIIRSIFIGAGIIAGLSLASCDLTTESQSTFDDRTVFADPTLTEYQIFSIYEVFGHTNGHRGRYLPWYGYNTDIEWYISNTQDDKAQIVQYAITTNNSQLNVPDGPYNELFAGVERANLAIDGIRKYGDPANRPEMAALLGEALTMRAVMYTELLKAFGEVPARFEPVSPATTYINKADKDVIYKQLLADLEEAFDYMAWPGESSATMSTDRASLALAKGLYARLALMASGYSLRPEEGMVGTKNPGRIRLSNDKALSKETLYPKALAALKDVIDNGGLELMDYEELWRSVNNMDLTAGKEIIWVIPFSNSRGRWNFTFAVRNNGRTQFSPTDSNRGGQAGPVPTLYWKYGENDVRRDISCVNYEWEDKDGDGTAEPYPAGIANWYFGKYRFEWMQTNPYTGGNDDGVKPVWMRYSDILLMAAEIANELKDTDSNNGKDYLKLVRRRAYKGHEDKADAYVDALAQGDEFFNAIVDERALEFVGEFLRKADLIRWNLLDKKLQDEEKALNNLAAEESLYAGRYLWYRYGTDAYGVTTIEMYGLDDDQVEAESSAYQPAGQGWEIYTNSEGEASKYFPDDGSMFEKKTIKLYNAGKTVDGHVIQWWPIFETSITSSQGALVNDYGF